MVPCVAESSAQLSAYCSLITSLWRPLQLYSKQNIMSSYIHCFSKQWGTTGVIHWLFVWRSEDLSAYMCRLELNKVISCFGNSLTPIRRKALFHHRLIYCPVELFGPLWQQILKSGQWHKHATKEIYSKLWFLKAASVSRTQWVSILRRDKICRDRQFNISLLRITMGYMEITKHILMYIPISDRYIIWW